MVVALIDWLIDRSFVFFIDANFFKCIKTQNISRSALGYFNLLLKFISFQSYNTFWSRSIWFSYFLLWSMTYWHSVISIGFLFLLRWLNKSQIHCLWFPLLEDKLHWNELYAKKKKNSYVIFGKKIHCMHRGGGTDYTNLLCRW